MLALLTFYCSNVHLKKLGGNKWKALEALVQLLTLNAFSFLMCIDSMRLLFFFIEHASSSVRFSNDLKLGISKGASCAKIWQALTV